MDKEKVADAMEAFLRTLDRQMIRYKRGDVWDVGLTVGPTHYGAALPTRYEAVESVFRRVIRHLETHGLLPLPR